MYAKRRYSKLIVISVLATFLGAMFSSALSLSEDLLYYSGEENALAPLPAPPVLDPGRF